MTMAWVEVQRVSGGQSKHLNPFELVIDDEVVGRLGPGESEAFEVASGSHEVFAKIYWCRSEKINVDLKQDQKLTFLCGTRARSFLTDGYWASFGHRRYLRLSQVASVEMSAADRGRRGGESSPSRRSAGATQGDYVERPAPLAVVTNAIRHRQSVVASVLLLAVVLLLFVLTWGLEFLASLSIIYMGMQAVNAINFHLLAPKSAFESGIKSHEPFHFRSIQATIISAAFGLAGLASLTGVLHADSVSGWLAIGAASAGAANVIVTRLVGTTAESSQASDPRGGQ